MAWVARRGSMVLVALIAITLPTLAILQYRWTGELSNLEQLRARTNLEIAAQRLSTEFDRALAALYAEHAGHRVSASETPAHVAASPVDGAVRHARMVKHAYVVARTSEGRFTIRDAAADGPHQGAASWPAWLNVDEQQPGLTLNGGFVPVALQRTIVDAAPAIVAPVAPDEWAVVELDLDATFSDVLPAMLAGCLAGGIPVSYDVLIQADDDARRVLYQSRPDLSASDFDSWVSHMPMFAIHGRDLEGAMARRLYPDAAVHRWRVFMKPQNGALEAAVSRARMRNLGIGAGVLALLALSVALLVASMHQSQRLARRQIEVVARMSHELRTPLAVITSAGENLADNVVAGAGDMQQYGRLIQQESQRLNKTIADILLCCRLQSRAQAVLSYAPTNLATVIELAVSDAERLISGTLPIEQSLDPTLPLVRGDQEALRVAIKNLLVNAVRHGGDAPVCVAARAGASDDVIVEITDRGRGIPVDELPHVFEPFFRGRRAVETGIEGSGIGLNLVYHVVRSHGGRVRAARVDPHGTRIVIELPSFRRGARIQGDSAA